MRILLVVSLLIAATLAYDFPEANENFDIDALIADVVALRKFSDCFLDKGPCDEVTSVFKAHVQDAVQTWCGKCTTNQKRLLRTYLQGLRNQLPDEYDEFVEKYDPKHKYFDKLKTNLKKNDN